MDKQRVIRNVRVSLIVVIFVVGSLFGGYLFLSRDLPSTARLELARDPVVWWKLTAAFVFMLGLVLPANLFGDALRDALDPRLRTE